VVLMPAKLTEDQRRLRGLTPSELADQVGALKADAADVESKIEAIKLEAIRRKLLSADGSMFRITLSPPGESRRVDVKALRRDKGEKFLAPYTTTAPTDWSMRCNALPRTK
jgi:hypothetical protein